MMAVPVPTPVITPVELTETADGLLLLQVPPDAASVKVEVAPIQTLGEPVIVPAAGAVPTVTADDELAVPQLFVEV